MPYTTSVGIDVSKKTLDVTVLTQGNSFHNKFANSRSGISDITSFLNEHAVSASDQVVMESTGDYHLLCAIALGESYNVNVINPLLAKQHMITTVRKVKTDKVDSKLLAEIGIKQELKTHKVTIEEIQKKKLIVLIDTLEKHLAALKLSIKNLKKASSELDITIYPLQEIEEKIKELELKKKHMHLEVFKLVKNKELVDNITSVRGVSQETAVKVVAMVEDRQFQNKRALVAFSGLDVSVKESGMWRGRPKISKRGNSQLRKYLVQIGWGLLMHNKEMQEYIKPYKEKGRKYLEILVILARKFLRMLYGAMKNKEAFFVNFH